ncbi:MAG TPA: FAD-linked oxidase C-terminal domain-containing protein [Propionibacteriaceae bacterium]|nr:FAD-linked oxidase C-terminal domain-containing protein [Propionibacteriaceae bacterium]
MNSAEVLAALAAALPSDALIVDPDVTRSLSHDEAEWAPVGEPIALIRATSSDQVATTVRICARFGVPVTARGAGTGLSGGANAIEGGVIIALDRLNQIRLIDPLERLAVVQAGVINDELRATAAEQGLWYPPDPASSPWSTIGGNIATNAGGVCCVKYGVTKDYVLALEVVTGTGDQVRLGRVTAKGVAGYDLVALMVGSEGTLGIITEATVRLKPLPGAPRTIVGYFSSTVDAGEAAQAVARAGVIPSALELIDRHCLAAVDKWKNMGLSLEADVVLLGRIDDQGVIGDDHADQMLACFEAAGATWAARSSDEEEAEALFAARRLAYPALERLGPVLTEDVCVPIGAVPEMLARIERIATKHRILIASIAHIGDGNLHPLLIAEPGDTAARDRAKLAFEEILTDALDLGGTVTGEHGVGLLKRGGLAQELSPAVLDMHRAVKAALDPHHILNPGKIF